MPAEAEATDILVRVFFEGAEYLLKFAGGAATKGVSLVCALGKYAIERTVGHKKLGGKINSRKFIDSFVASSIFPLSKADFDKLKPELKRLHIPYMQYKSTKEMKENGIVEISVRAEDAERFIRCAENIGIASVEPYDLKVEELTPEEYEQALNNSGSQGVEVNISEDGITVNGAENPTQAPTDPSIPSEQNSKESQSSNPYDMIFNPQKNVNSNLEDAKTVAARRNGDLIPISADKETLLVSENKDNVVLTVPGTKKSERLVIPREDIVSTDANGGQAVTADLKPNKSYDILDKNGNFKRKMTGNEINASQKWNNAYAPQHKPQKTVPKVPTPKKVGVK